MQPWAVSPTYKFSTSPLLLHSDCLLVARQAFETNWEEPKAGQCNGPS